MFWCRLLPLGLSLWFAQPLFGWRSVLYPEDWTPPTNVEFNVDLFLQDFSYAGYRYGVEPLPNPQGPLYNVLDYGADPGGSADSTNAIQDAINAAILNGSGVVYLPEGLYRVAPPPGASQALIIQGLNIVFRGDGPGKTRLLNTATDMRGKSVLRISGFGNSFLRQVGSAVNITSDLLGPTTVIPVADASPFAVGDEIVLRADATEDWIAEHQMADLWGGYGSNLGGVAFFREIVGLDLQNNLLIIDTPTRYSLKTRDDARVTFTDQQVSETGLEDFSIANVEHPSTTGWDEQDYTRTGTGAYDAHGSWLIRVENLRHGWVRNVHSFLPDGNTLGSHMLSNGLLVVHSRNVTVRDCVMERVMYGGGGGNGYTYRITNSQEILLMDCIARNQRHAFVHSQMRNSGNVFHRVLCEETTWQAAGDGRTNGRGSDHHMHFSQSNLIDQSVGNRDFYDAAWRGTWGTIPHGLTATQSTYWNLVGQQAIAGRNYIVKSDQYGLGFVIGTSGTTDNVSSGPATHRTQPADYVEGEGQGATLEPASLYRDQVLRRTGLPLTAPDATRDERFPTNVVGFEAYLALVADVDWGMAENAGRRFAWEQTGGPPVSIADPTAMQTIAFFPEPGTYTFRLHLDNGWLSNHTDVEMTLSPNRLIEERREAEADAWVRGGAYVTENRGTDARLAVKYSANADVQREAYLRFDLSDLPEAMTAARFAMTVDDPGAQPLIQPYATSGDWTELGLNWNNKPDLVVPLDPFTPVDGTIEIPVPAQLVRDARDVFGHFGLGLVTTVTTSPLTYFAGREDPDPLRRPRLVLTSEAGTAYLAWARDQFGAAVVDDPAQYDDVWGPAANPDRDADANAVEAASGGDADLADAAALDLLEDGHIGYRVALRGVGAQAFPYESSDGQTWTRVPLDRLAIHEVTATHAIIRIAPGTAERWFVRLEAIAAE